MIGRYFHTLKYLKPVQVYGRIWFRLYRPRVSVSDLPSIRERIREFSGPFLREVSLVASNRFRFLNVSGVLETPRDWDNPEWPKLWRYNLHYFDDLNAVNSAERVDWHHALIDRWIGENPPTSGTGWEPYPSSLRIVNWIKWAARGNTLSDRAIESLVVQTRWLRQRLEVHILGNHLLANAKALYYSGLFFRGKEAEAWLRRARSIIDQQFAEQILPDGGHFELSPMYHCIILEDLLDLVNISRSYGHSVPDEWENYVERMLDWMDTMSHPDGQIGFFNDAAFGIAASPSQLKAYARSLGYGGGDWGHLPVHHLTNSGYVRVEKGPAVMLADVAAIGPDYLPGHAHADTLSFELSLYGQRVLVNSGVSEYGDGPERSRQRGTSAHNTVEVDSVDSSEVWGGFRVARRAKVTVHNVELGENEVTIDASHNGYCRLRGKPVHRRTWTVSNQSINIQDEITGSGKHSIVSYLHIHPSCHPELLSTNAVRILNSRHEVLCHVLFKGEGTLKVEPSTYHSQFGISSQTQRLVYSVGGLLPTRLETEITWDSQGN